MNRILKSSCIISLTGFLLFPGVAVSRVALEASTTGCMAEGDCTGSQPYALRFVYERHFGLMLSYRNGNVTVIMKNVMVSVFQLPDRNDTFHFQYRIYNPQICHVYNSADAVLPRATTNVFNPWISCTVNDTETGRDEGVSKTINFHTRVNNLECVRDTDNNDYSLTWDSVGCVDDVIVTLVTDSGEIVQMPTENNGTYTVTSGMDNLRLAYVAPVVSADGSGDGQAECRNVVTPDFQKPVRPTIYSVHHMNQTVIANVALPLRPDQTYSLMFGAPLQAFISIATMKMHSNDLFLAFGDKGLPLFNNATGLPLYNQVTDVSSELHLWDAGTEANEKPGLGNRQPLKSKASRPDSQNWVRCHDRRFDNTPNVTELVSANIQYVGSTNGNYRFVFNLKNEGASFAPNPGCEEEEELFSPGLCVVHSEGNALFTAGQPDYGDGLKALAEEGKSMPLYIKLEQISTGSFTATNPTATNPTAPNSAAHNSAAISAISNLLLAVALIFSCIL